MFFFFLYCLSCYLLMKFAVSIETSTFAWKKSTSSLSGTWAGFSASSSCSYSWSGSLLVDSFSLTTLVMVCGVVLMVSLYSEVYLEHYNSFKFLALMLLFFFSMVLLVSSKSILILMTGWDWLGVSSLFLIMFYPNKLTLFNSYLTMMFNRLGDVVLMSVLCLYLLDPQSFYFLLPEHMLVPLSVLILCAFTKSAQFPVSSWLPAAMSAPTPISAMVHSSTLVTAGLCIVFKVLLYLELYSLPHIFLFFSLLSFMMGGLMASEEMDFKKIVAFSTMSQISMIMSFCFLGAFVLSLSHMLFHAFFKTLLFCCCGTYFLANLSNQLFKNMAHPSNILLVLLFLSIFSMSGLTFSSSFLSKDKLLEMFLLADSSFFMLIFTAGSMLTLAYCSKILLLAKFSLFGSFFMNKGLIPFFWGFSLVSVTIGLTYNSLTGSYFTPICSWEEISALLLVFILVIYFQGQSSKIYPSMKYLTIDIFLMKSLTFSMFSSVYKESNLKFLFTDVFAFKPKFFSFTVNLETVKYSVPFAYSFYLILSLFHFI